MSRCQKCSKAVLPESRWRKADKAQRATWLAENVGRMVGRGLCRPCYNKHRDEFDRKNRPVDETVEEWGFLADSLVPTKREALRLAPQLGMSPKRLQTIVSTELGSRFRGGWGERVKKIA